MFPSGWALGQGTDQSRNPYLTGEHSMNNPPEHQIQCYGLGAFSNWCSTLWCIIFWDHSKLNIFFVFGTLPDFCSSSRVLRGQKNLARGFPHIPGVTIRKITTFSSHDNKIFILNYCVCSTARHHRVLSMEATACGELVSFLSDKCTKF